MQRGSPRGGAGDFTNLRPLQSLVKTPQALRSSPSFTPLRLESEQHRGVTLSRHYRVRFGPELRCDLDEATAELKAPPP